MVQALSEVTQPIEHAGVSEAMNAAMEDAASSGGRVFPCVVFLQGGRIGISTAFPYSFVAKHVKPDSAVKGGDPRSATNRPMIPDHVRRIRDYLKANKDEYILPPVTLNVRKMPQAHVQRSNAAVRIGYLVVPDETVFYVTDGQHRIAALAGYSSGRANIPGLLAEDPEMSSDGLAVLIVVEPQLVRIHQDFADAAQTKQIPASLLAAYNMREPLNRVLHRIVEGSDFLRGRVDETSKTLGKLSQSVFLLNQVRGLLKELLVGDYGVTDDLLARVALQRLGKEEQQEAFVRLTLQLLGVLSSDMEPWPTITQLPREGAVANQIPDFRKDYLNLTATGLVIIGHVAFEVNKKISAESGRLASYKKLAGDIDWKRGAAIWRGTIITEDGGRLVTNRQPVRDAAKAVSEIVLSSVGSTEST